MGVTLFLGFNEGNNEVGKHCGKSFFAEIISGGYPDYFNLDNFLTNEEQKLLYPDYDGDYSTFEEIRQNCRHIDPEKLNEVFKKVYNYLLSNYDKFPLTHMIGKNKFQMMGSSDDFIYKGQLCYLNGFHNNYIHRNELQLVFRNGSIMEEWIPVSEVLNLEGNIFHTSTSNKFEEYKEILEACILTCENALKTNRKVHWTYSR